MKIITKENTTIEIEFYLWEINRIARSLPTQGIAKVDEEILKKLWKIINLYDNK